MKKHEKQVKRKGSSLLLLPGTNSDYIQMWKKGNNLKLLCTTKVTSETN